MILPLYQINGQPHSAPQKGQDFHRGLWFERFFSSYGKGFSKPEDQAKKEWIDDTVKGMCGNEETLKNAALRHHQLLTHLKGECRVFKTEWHFSTGMGLPHPVENGFTWHPTLGTPYLTGAAVKGLIRAYVEIWDERFDDEADLTALKKRLHFWFGSEDKDPKKCTTHTTQGGAFIFFDAIPIAPPKLATDIMTPHMTDWYEADDEKPIDIKNAPADWHEPCPVPFLVVQDASFLFSVAVRQNLPEALKKEAQNELENVIECLKNALDWLGAGAKTAAGYGRMKSGKDEAHMFSKTLESAIHERKRKQDENQEIKLLETLPPQLAEKIKLYVQKRRSENKSCSFHSILKRGLKERWHGAERLHVEAMLKKIT